MSATPDQLTFELTVSLDLDHDDMELVRQKVAAAIAADHIAKKFASEVAAHVKHRHSKFLSIKVDNPSSRDWPNLRQTLSDLARVHQCDITVDFNGQNFRSCWDDS